LSDLVMEWLDRPMVHSDRHGPPSPDHQVTPSPDSA
jgi:hypothetical protein